MAWLRACSYCPIWKMRSCARPTVELLRLCAPRLPRVLVFRCWRLWLAASPYPAATRHRCRKWPAIAPCTSIRSIPPPWLQPWKPRLTGRLIPGNGRRLAGSARHRFTLAAVQGGITQFGVRFKAARDDLDHHAFAFCDVVGCAQKARSTLFGFTFYFLFPWWLDSLSRSNRICVIVVV